MQKTNYLSVNDIEPITNTWDKLMMILQEVSIVLFIVNVILCCSAIKLKIKNKGLFGLSIIMFFISYCSMCIYEYGGAIGSNHSYMPKAIMVFIPFIVQIIIFIKLVIKIKRKGGKSKCQE